MATWRIKFPDGGWEDELDKNFDPTGCEDRVYTKATVEYENPMTGETETYENVGVRYRGHNIYTDEPGSVERHGYKLSFDEFVEDRTFHGLRKIDLLGTEGDYSLMHEHLAFEMMRGLGVPAPRNNHALVYVNGKFMGVFPNSEESDDQPFLTAHFTDDSGSLYKVKGYCGYRADLQYDGGDTPEGYLTTYEPKAGTEPADMTEDLMPMLQCASTKDDAEFRSCIETWIDVDEWLTEVAVDMVLPDVDGMASAGQNFMLYQRPDTHQFVTYPWDKDLSFYLTTLNDTETGIWDLHPAWLENSQPTLVNRLRNVYSDEFCGKVLAAADWLSPDNMDPEIDALSDLMRPGIQRDPFIQEDMWNGAVQGIKDSIAQRNPQVVAEAKACTPK
jgi:spore coat protein CotH